jgi:hypothetical protein
LRIGLALHSLGRLSRVERLFKQVTDDPLVPCRGTFVVMQLSHKLRTEQWIPAKPE